MPVETIKTIAVIGAGVAGLSAARLLQQAGFLCRIFEKGDCVGGQWAKGYHTYGLQTPRNLYEIPDYPMPDCYPRVPSGAEMQAYFENYARDFNLFDKIKFHSHVVRLESLEPRGWRVHYYGADGETQAQEFDFIVVASGLYFDPYIPELPGKDRYQGEILHSAGYRSPAQVTGRDVVVVGYGKSALDVAEDAAKFAKKVSLLFRKPHWPIPMDILDVLDVRRIYLTRLACALLPPYQRHQPWVKTLHSRLNGLVKGFWRFTEGVIQFQYPLKECGILPTEPIETDIFNLGYLPRKAVFQLMRQGKIQNRRDQIRAFSEHGVELASGESIPCDVVIFGTGYRSDTGFMPDAFCRAQEADGVYLYRHIIHPDLPNMAFIGRAASFSNCLTSHLASVWLAHLLKGRFQLPARDQMLAEIQAIKDWKRSFMPAISSRASVVNLHMLHYHDDLLRDFGADPYRKANRLSEWLKDYRPADYRAVMNITA